MKRKAFLFILKAAAFIAVFCIVFLLLQGLLVPKYKVDGTLFVSDFYGLERDSIDVLFLGASQITCGVDTPRLRQYHDIRSFNFCTSGSFFDIEEYYLKEALKTQSPKLVVADAGNIFIPDEELINPLHMSYFYPTMPLDKYKVESLYEVSDGDLATVFSYSFPLFLYHSRWKEVTAEDITFYTKYKYIYDGGFIRRDYAANAKIKFFDEDDGIKNAISERKKSAIERMEKICKDNGITLLFIKIPSPNWTRSDSEVLTEYMNKNSLDCIDLNIYFNEIGLDPDQDFLDQVHLNFFGAEKTTDFLADIIHEKLDKKELI